MFSGIIDEYSNSEIKLLCENCYLVGNFRHWPIREDLVIDTIRMRFVDYTHTLNLKNVPHGRYGHFDIIRETN